MKNIVGIWGIQDGSDRTRAGWMDCFPTHDHSVCRIEDGKIVKSFELERITRIKHDSSLSKNIERFVDYFDEESEVVLINDYNGNSFISQNGLVRVEGDRFHISEIVKEANAFVNRKRLKAYICPHELAHIGAILPFTGEFKNNSLLVHCDGLASVSNISVFKYKNKKLKHIYHGWDLLESAQLFGFNRMIFDILGLKENNYMAAPGRLMGYASYGNDNKQVYDWLVKNDWFKDYDREKFFGNINKEFNVSINQIDLHNQIFSDIAYCCQKKLQEDLLKFLKKYQKKTKTDYLYYSGGVALNIVANSEIVNSKIFKEVHIPPCCSDSGLAIGGAALVYFIKYGNLSKHSPFLGTEGCNNEYSINDKIIEECCDVLVKEKVIGVCIGNAESGPRALGHRSIIAIPTSQKMYDKINTDIKKREWYRPLAPIVMEDIADDVFINSTNDYLSRYMLGNYDVNEKYVNIIPAVVHINKTARAQVIYKEDSENSIIYKILKVMWEKYGIPCLINTSFNVNGQPILNSTDEAINSFKNIGLDYLLCKKGLISAEEMV